MEGAASASLPFLLVLAGAFIFAYFCHYTSYQAARVEGQRLLFLAAGWAMGLLVLSRIFLLVTDNLTPHGWDDEIATAWRDLTGPFYAPALATFFGAFVWGFSLPWPINYLFRANRASARAIRKYGGEVEKLLYRAMTEERMVAVTLENRKVYIGWPVFTPDPRRNTEDFRILPDASGYRADDTLTVKITTEYSPVYNKIRQEEAAAEAAVEEAVVEEIPAALKGSDFEIAIPLEKLITVNLFSPDTDQSLFNRV